MILPLRPDQIELGGHYEHGREMNFAMGQGMLHSHKLSVRFSFTIDSQAQEDQNTGVINSYVPCCTSIS